MISKIWFNVSTPLRKVFICNIEIGNSNWLLCNTVAVSEMNLFACETISFHNSFNCVRVLCIKCANMNKMCLFLWRCFFFYLDTDLVMIQFMYLYIRGFFTCHFIFLWNFNRKQSHALAHIVLKVFLCWNCDIVVVFLFSTSGNFSILP